MTQKVGKLAQRMREGHSLNVEEIDWVADELKKNPTDLEVYEGLLILGVTKAKRHRDVVEYFLFLEDFVYSETALRMVYRYWKDYKRYRDFALELIRGVAWDEAETMRSWGITVVGPYLRENLDIEVVRAIFEAYLDSGDRIVQVQSYYVLSSLIELTDEEKVGPPKKPKIRSTVVEKIAKFVEGLEDQ